MGPRSLGDINSISTVSFVWLIQRLSALLAAKWPVRSATEQYLPISTAILGEPIGPQFFNFFLGHYMLFYWPQAFLPARSSLQNWSKEHLACCCCWLTCHIAASSPTPRACTTLLISRMTSSRSEYHCSSLWRPALQRLPYFLSSALIAGLPCSPTVHLRQSASTVLTAQHIRCWGGSSSSRSWAWAWLDPLGPCSDGLGKRVSG